MQSLFTTSSFELLPTHVYLLLQPLKMLLKSNPASFSRNKEGHCPLTQFHLSAVW